MRILHFFKQHKHYLMEKASFSLKDYKFIKVELDFSNLNSSSLELIIEPEGVFHHSTGVYELAFVFKAIAEMKNENENNQIIFVKCIALFEFNEILNFEDIPDYFYTNSIAILFPYIRAFVSTLTLQANIPPIVLPTMNLISLQEKLKANTKEI